MRDILLQDRFSTEHLFIGLILSLCFVALAYVVLIAVYRHVVKMGLLARYSAESL